MKAIFLILKWFILLTAIIAVGVYAFLKFHPVWGGQPDVASMAKIQASKNYNGTQFQNLEPTPLLTSEEPVSIWQWAYNRLTATKGKNPSESLPTVKLDNNRWQNGSIAWLGHSSVIFQTGGKKFITDPVFYYDSPVPFTVEPFAMTNKPVIDDLPEIDVVLISHDHYDHLDYRAIKEIVEKGKAKHFVVPLGVKAHLVRWGVAADMITELDWQEQTRVEGIAITFVPARHFSGREMNGQNQTLWGGYVVKSPDLSLYFSADSGYGKHYAEIIAKYAPFDFVMIENGAYDPKWALIHEQPEESVQALKDIQATKAMPIHWGKFDLANHPWKEPIERFLAAAESANFDIATPKIGQIFHIEDLPKEKWWEAVR
ncbi:MBL fold metallo-hydrolase [Rodentibacter genomosp. 2]|uniref:Multidrug transporter n=1 Tax=Rodentibacter genomosp. 2 TaxID=1908266 RepID=A0A1V3JGX6_9PAST|nr:MBL fold metallo-hydrolase [Rodentibacter genomosp. 2]OOF55863.1 multidrug transporter [Rodentibacter genomosp. 2]